MCSVVLGGSIPNPAPTYDGHPFNATADQTQWSKYGITIEASTDGGSWNVVASPFELYRSILPQSFNGWAAIDILPSQRNYRYWRLTFDAQLGGGGFAGGHYFGEATSVTFAPFRGAS